VVAFWWSTVVPVPYKSATKESHMATSIEPDIATLQADIQQLRTDLAKMTTTMRDVAGKSIAQVGDKAQASAEKVWVEVKRQAQQVGHEIGDRPLTATLAAFGTGLVLGLLLSVRRG
jgi:ElaB/YqjD/DUF883 family membrane-anchored ribosome-binding protein